MKRSLLAGFALLLPLHSVLAVTTFPCRPNELRRVHVSAFVDSPSTSAPHRLSELQYQQECIAWEARVQPKAEFATPTAEVAAGVFVLSFSPKLGGGRSSHERSADRPVTNPPEPSSLLSPAPRRFSLRPSDFSR